MEIDVQIPTVSVFPETFGDSVAQSWFKQKIATEVSPEDVLRWAEEVT